MKLTEPYLACSVRIVEPYPYTHFFSVKPDEAGMPLLSFLTRRFPFRPGHEWSERIMSGLVTVNGGGCRPSDLLAANDRISHHNPSVTEPAVPDGVRVLDESPDWLVVYKPAPMPVHPGGRYNKNTLTAILEEMGYSGLKIVHRLDAVTSGIILFARNSTSALAIQRAFIEGTVDKWYYALVAGLPANDRVTIDRPIMRKKGFVFTCSDKPEAREAQTRFEVVINGEGKSVIKCIPVTGRTHQIRLHLREWGHPVINDTVYGPGGDDSSMMLQNRSIYLQSSCIEIEELGISHQIGVPSDWELKGAI
ncbi:MAG: RluA family pseudouridine synthase [Balneolaceae bacterium]|nr:MAG: RluA family pseudouridine synthase [Balneolaceae bacterium]